MLVLLLLLVLLQLVPLLQLVSRFLLNQFFGGATATVGA